MPERVSDRISLSGVFLRVEVSRGTPQAPGVNGTTIGYFHHDLQGSRVPLAKAAKRGLGYGLR
jgi:hypothetical protein